MSVAAIAITDDDIPYELDILKTPDAIEPWLRYIDFKATSSLRDQCFLYARATRIFKRSYKLWKAYLDIRTQAVRYISYDQNPDAIESVYNSYDEALTMLSKMPRIWTDYLEFLVRTCPEVTRIRRKFDEALKALPISQHDRIWPLYLQLADSSAPPATQCMIWRRYMQYDDSEIERFISVLKKNGAYQEAAEVLIKAIDNPDFASSEGKSRFQLWEDLLEILVHEDTNMDVDRIIKSAIARYPDQTGRLYVNLATYYITRRKYDQARDVFEEGIEQCMTVRDFTQIFDSYVEFDETLISQMLENDDPEADTRMEAFEMLMDKRPFMISDILLKQDKNNVAEWMKRAVLYENEKKKMVETFTEAILQIEPKKANGKFSELWIQYAKVYEDAGDLKTARILFDKATKVPYKNVEELADVWIAWAEMELRNDNETQALKVLETATKSPKVSKINYFDENLSPQERLHKCMKLWAFYIDLAECTDDISLVRPIYDRVFELKIATALTCVNYAALLEQHQYYEDSFQVYERGVALFTYPVAFELWNIYLKKAVDRNLGMERLRTLFEHALENCPPNLSQSIFLLYASVEEERGMMANAIDIYRRAVTHVAPEFKLKVYKIFIAYLARCKGLPATRPVFNQALDSLPDRDANDIARDYISVETKLGDNARARALYGYASQFNDPDMPSCSEFWDRWAEFEVQHGNETTYKEMLRIKRETRKRFSNNVMHMARKEVQREQALTGLRRAATTTHGFVAATNTPQVGRSEEIEVPASNPDEIDVDMDDI